MERKIRRQDGYSGPEVFRLFLEDTGLFVTLCFYDGDFADNAIYKGLVSGRLPANLGYVYENAAAQSLTAAGYGLFYHTFLKDDGRHRYEVDFIVPSGKKICPIEVKSSNISSHVSFDVFLKKHRQDVRTGIVVSPKNLKTEDGILYLPIYMMGLIGRVAGQRRRSKRSRAELLGAYGGYIGSASLFSAYFPGHLSRACLSGIRHMLMPADREPE